MYFPCATLSSHSELLTFLFWNVVQLSVVVILLLFPDNFESIVFVTLFLNVSFLVCVIIVLGIFFQHSANVFNIWFILKKFITDVFPGFEVCSMKKGIIVSPFQ